MSTTAWAATDPAKVLPDDGYAGTLVGRVWLPAANGQPAGRALDQLRTTVAYGNLNVKIIGAHGGVSVGPDGATHQALEEFYQIAGLPNMNLLVPADSVETKKATNAMIEKIRGPCYLRTARESTPVISDANTPYSFGVSTTIRFRGEQPKFVDAFETVLSPGAKDEGEDISIVAAPGITWQYANFRDQANSAIGQLIAHAEIKQIHKGQ